MHARRLASAAFFICLCVKKPREERGKTRGALTIDGERASPLLPNEIILSQKNTAYMTVFLI